MKTYEITNCPVILRKAGLRGELIPFVDAGEFHRFLHNFQGDGLIALLNEIPDHVVLEKGGTCDREIIAFDLLEVVPSVLEGYAVEVFFTSKDRKVSSTQNYVRVSDLPALEKLAGDRLSVYREYTPTVDWDCLGD